MFKSVVLLQRVNEMEERVQELADDLEVEGALREEAERVRACLDPCEYH